MRAVRPVTRKRRSYFEKALRRAEDVAVQWLWFALPIKAERIGYGKGPLTWLRQRNHRKLRRKIHICLLDYMPEGGRQTKLTEFWINERSRLCSASMNDRIGDADVVWVYCKDPIPPDKKSELLQTLKRAKPGTPVINHPELYNAYHEERTFERLAQAGVSVPRSRLTDEDVGTTMAVYKTEGRHGHAPKFLSEYTGPRAGYRAFEFIDSRSSEGLYRRYRAYYILGAVCPGRVLFSDRWNVLAKTSTHSVPFVTTPEEAAQIRQIAKTLGLQYFAVDYLRRKDDDSPVFVDLNVYPDIRTRSEKFSRKSGYYGRWHSFDTRTCITTSDISEQPCWEAFDEAMSAFAVGEDLSYGDTESRG